MLHKHHKLETTHSIIYYINVSSEIVCFPEVEVKKSL